MSARQRCLALLVAVALCAPDSWADDDIATSLFVSAGGADVGDCDERDAPCASLRFALTQARPGQTIRVAAGVYDVAGIDPESYLWGVVKAAGGFDRNDEFAQPDPLRNVTTLVGLDVRYRTVLAARGFKLAGADESTPATALQQVQVVPAACTQGRAGQFPCRDIDFAAQIPLSGFTSQPSSASNVWGLVDLNDNREYVLVGLRNGTAIVEVTNSESPRQVTTIPGNSSLWRELRILQRRDAAAGRWRSYAYVSTEAPGSGIQVIDLSGLPNSATLATTLSDTGSQHTVFVSGLDYATNVALPGATPFLYVAGANVNGGAWRAYSLANPLTPQLVGTAPAGSGYMHDSAGLTITDNRTTQCAQAHNPCELLFDFNESTVDLWDVTDKAAPVRLSSTGYPTASYTHSGWPSSDGRYLFVHDELDELRRGLNTQIYTLDLADLRIPRIVTSFTGAGTATDHNGYVKGSLLYVSHYRRGLVVFDASNPERLVERANFDTFLTPAADTAGTDGAWGVYPFLPSGTIAISDIDNGLFLLKDRIAPVQASAGRLGFADAALGVSEAAGPVTVRVRRTGGSLGAVSLLLATRDGTATAGSDYSATTATLSWPDGDATDKLVSIALLNDAQTESDEQFVVSLTNLAGGAALDGSADLTVSILNDDIPPNPVPAPAGGGGGMLGSGALAALLALFMARQIFASILLCSGPAIRRYALRPDGRQASSSSHRRPERIRQIHNCPGHREQGLRG